MQSDHKFDALVCALVARAAETDHIIPLTDPARAAVEGVDLNPDGTPALSARRRTRNSFGVAGAGAPDPSRRLPRTADA